MKLSTLSAAAALAFSAFTGAFAAAPAQPPRNPFLADSSYAIAHANSAQTDSTADAGPVGPSATLRSDEMRYQDLGMFNLAYLVSSPYEDGKRVVWTNGSQFMAKLDEETFDIVSTIRMPGEDHADSLTHENFIRTFDSHPSFDKAWETVQQSGYPPISGVYTMLDKDNRQPVRGRGQGLRAHLWRCRAWRLALRHCHARPVESASGRHWRVHRHEHDV
ncbi:hypothetical protein LMG26411_05239 [Cupriavidus numazuensis]|uniref:Uncharacterized protein n=1 Tax=Cupriavidus numazuensis TaxID=221992 RepID=A0ABN7Q438_9BURK|nr:hypothetical protein LMG26411_05239 [Cupriavidus numazuensis]